MEKKSFAESFKIWFGMGALVFGTYCGANMASGAYAAGYITKLVLERAAANQPAERKGWRLWLKNDDEKHQIHQDKIGFLDLHQFQKSQS